jgi:hypothetical protein
MRPSHLHKKVNNFMVSKNISSLYKYELKITQFQIRNYIVKRREYVILYKTRTAGTSISGWFLIKLSTDHTRYGV